MRHTWPVWLKFTHLFAVMNMPDLRYGHVESPSPFSYNGAKGMGEGGGAPLHALSAALQDALYPRAIVITDSHNTGDSIFQAFERARHGTEAPVVRVEHLRGPR